MSILGQFAAPVQALLAQSESVQNVGTNIANVNTGGYKRIETNFSTLLSRSYGAQNDIGGVRAYSRTAISDQGNIRASSSNFDVAINGNGFFILNSQVDGNGETFYGRDGALQQRLGATTTQFVNGEAITIREGYLVDKNGYFIQGYPVNEDGVTFSTNPSDLQSIRIDENAFTANGQATTQATLGLNLPSDQAQGFSDSTFIEAYDADGNLTSYQLRFTNLVLGSATLNATPEWNLPATAAVGYTATQDVTVYNTQGAEQTISIRVTKTGADTWDFQALEGSTAIDIDGTNDGVANPVSVTFDPITGALIGPASFSVATTQPNGTTFAFNLANITQNAGLTLSVTDTVIDGTGAQAIDNNWTLEVFEADGTPVAIDSDATPNRLQLIFTGDGSITTPTEITIPGSSGSFTLDITGVTNFASGQIVENDYDFNGASDSRLVGFEFNSQGEILGRFSDATSRPIYRLPLATFTNINGLDTLSGNVYRYTDRAGDIAIREAGLQGTGQFIPNAQELSNVELSDEFTKLIITQNAYNSSSTALQTLDEMAETIRDLKA